MKRKLVLIVTLMLIAAVTTSAYATEPTEAEWTAFMQAMELYEQSKGGVGCAHR